MKSVTQTKWSLLKSYPDLGLPWYGLAGNYEKKLKYLLQITVRKHEEEY